MLTLVRFGRFDEVLQVTKRPTNDVQGGLWDFATGYAYLKQGQADLAQRVSRAREESGRNLEGRVPRATPPRICSGIVAGILEGEIKRMAGDVARLDRAVHSARSISRMAMTYDEPEPLPFSPRHWLGAALVELKKFEDAEKVYRADLKEHPKNGWSLLGLKQALAGRGARHGGRGRRTRRRAGRARTRGSGRAGSEALLQPADDIQRRSTPAVVVDERAARRDDQVGQAAHGGGRRWSIV